MTKPALQQIYNGSFKDRPRFDGGGYVDYSGGDLSPIDTSYADQMYNYGNSGAPTAGDISNETAGAANLSTPVNPGQTPDMPAIQGGSSSQQGALSKILAGMGLGGGDTSNAAALGAAVKLLSAYGQYKQNAAGSKLPTMPALGALPTLPGSSTAGYGPAGGYNFQNYNTATPGARTATPTPPQNSYFTYGQGPEQQFFQQVTGGGPIAPVHSATGGPVHMARGGAVPHFDMGGMVPNVGGMQQVLGQGAMAQPGQTPMTPRPPMPQAPQMPQQPPMSGAPQPPQVQQPNPGMMRPNPGMPPQPPQGQPSTMMQRMNAARPVMRAGGGPAAMPGDIPLQNPKQMAASSVLQSQNPHTLGNAYRRTAGVSAAQPGGSSPMLVQRADGGSSASPSQGALEGIGQSRHVTGPGDGTSDSIPARLANGEYVIDAQAVSMLGNGDNSAGAKRLDEFRKNLRQHKGGALAKGKMAPNAKPIHKYMGGQ